ncbi:ATP-binding cassette domain-containing protein [Cohnella cholangitidis]|uniref:ATP-binding cassette domain-containing protein n=1 Tax=Cohnella cholangitidis TaxID=2598458 RepID=A0A7G5C2V1_9BACL|nr:ATP-binding cassette domain-containing protein [Cohnella cholangitidis]QMV43535.1 ATP-binding cassette domain-containing protein [Cohnella cholangitidis]
MKTVLQWFVYLSRGSHGLLSAAILMMVAIPLLSWFQFKWSQRFFNQITADLRDQLALLVGLLIGLFAIKALESALTRFNGYVQESLLLNLNRRIEAYQFELIQPSDITRMETPSYQQDLNLLNNNLTKLGQLLHSCLTVVKEIGIIVVYAYLIIAQSWLVLAAVVAFSFPNLLYVWRHASRLDLFFERISQAQMESSRVTSFLIMPMAIKEMLVFAAKPFFLAKWETASDKVIGQRRLFMKSEYFWGLLVDLFLPIKYAVTQLILISLLYRGEMGLGDYLAVTASLTPLDNAIRSLIVSTDTFINLRLFREKWSHFHNRYLSHSKADHSHRIDTIRNIRAEQLTFRYPERDSPALHHVSLRLNGSGSLAIVGANGSGKSTLAKILSGLHRVEENRLFYNDVPIERIDRETLLRRISIVSQDFVKYPLSVYENISLNKNNGVDPKYENIKTRYTELIPSNLIQYPDTVLGNEYLNSIQLSGGQWQRIAIARGLYKDCDMLLLDEATSELDPVAEMELIAKILTDRKDKMTVIVTHNLRLAMLTDTVIVMEDGRIAEQGPPTRLAEYSSLFKRMQDKQIPSEVPNGHGFQNVI